MIPKDIYDRKEYWVENGVNPARTTSYRQFKKDNGIFLPFYTDRRSFRDDFLKLLEKNNLKYIPSKYM